MRKYFGTDGIRRIANTELSPGLVYRVAKAGAYVLAKHSDHAPTILIGRDTRISGTLIESAMTAGFLSYGANVKSLGVIPTPGVAYLTKKLKADASVVISASHNTYEFNGVKYFSNKGMKIPDEIEEEIEEIMDSDKLDEFTAVNDKIGIAEVRSDLLDEYVYFFRKNFEEEFESYDTSDFVVAIDTANGATSVAAEKVFTALGIKHYIMNNTPNGVNINENCGSTHLDMIKKYVVENNCNLGIAYDGDGDRCLAIDEKGNEIDGDRLLAVISNYMKKKGTLKNDTVVATVMSNLGLKKYAENNNLNLVQTKVGDRYVLEEMLKNGYNIGGEQSGHIIFLDENTTGDGLLSALHLLQVMTETKKKLSELASIMEVLPQALVNAKVPNHKKEHFEEYAEIAEAIAEVEAKFAGEGRVLIRPSGTEPLVRVMIEGKDQQLIESEAQKLAELISSIML